MQPPVAIDGPGRSMEDVNRSKVAPSTVIPQPSSGSADASPLQGNSVVLSTLSPGPGERRAALAIVLVSMVLFLAGAPFAQVPLAQLPAFLPIYQSALVVNDLITATLLFGQYGMLRTRALLVLACGYLFSAAMAVAHALSFPGLFAPAGVFGAGTQATAWLYFLWHAGFPLFVIAYALLKSEQRTGSARPEQVRFNMLSAAAGAVTLAVAITLLTTAGHSVLPPIMIGNADAPAKLVVAVASWMFGLGALAVLWRRRPHSMLDLWLLVVLCVWTFDTAMASMLNHGRYDLGWYAGRIYGLLASGFVLVILLLENSVLYARLADANERARRKAADLQLLSVQLQAANESLAEKNTQLLHASGMKSEFLANMSHELRTPLNAVIGFSDVLKDGLVGELSEEQREYITDIHASGQHLLSLINDILDLSKIEAGQMSLDLDPTAINEFLDQCMSIVREKAARRGVQLGLDLSPGLGMVAVDLRKTRQIVYNLLSNAVKFSVDGGQVTLRARRVGRSELECWSDGAPTVVRRLLPAERFDEYLQIVVEDNGIGIAPEDVPRLFRMFAQLDSSLARGAEGTGLGLMLVDRLAQLHGGTVALASNPKQGTRLVVWLPWRQSNTTAAALPNPRRLEPTAGSRPMALVIEDNERAGELMRLQLEPAGFEVVRVATARAALDSLSSRQPALIVLDLLLPDMDGWDLLALLKQANSVSAHIPVVIVSIVADVKKGFALGATAVLQKPVTREELLGALADAGVTAERQSATVLIVDDDPKAVELLALYLNEPGYRVLRAHGGREGLESARREPPDLIVLDLMMPEVSGFDVVEALKERPDTAMIPIIVVTAKTLTAQDKAALNGLVAVVLEKAVFDVGRFLNEVRRVVAAGRGTPP